MTLTDMAQASTPARGWAEPEPMVLQQLDHGLRSNDSYFSNLSEPDEAAASQVHREVLPFTVGIVKTEAQLGAVQALRALAYEHHLPGLGDSFGDADAIDRSVDCIIFYVQDKASGAVVGSARIQTNRFVPLQMERSAELPVHRQGQLLAEVTRLVVRPGYVGPVRLALLKAIQLYCLAMQIRGLVAGSRSALLRSYRQLGFVPLFDEGRMVSLAHAGGLPHHVLIRETAMSPADGRDHGREAYDFIFRRYHPDIEVFASTEQASLGAAMPQMQPYANAA